MTWGKFYQSLSFHLNRLYKWKWGYIVLSGLVSIIVFLLGIIERQQSIGDLLFTSFVYGPFLMGIVFLIKKYGWEGFATKTIEVTVKILFAVGKILIIPFQILWDVFIGIPLRFIFESIPNRLPVIVRPLYRFSWSAFFAVIVYFAVWVLFSIDAQSEHFIDVELLGTSYHLVKAGLEFSCLILGFALLDFLPAYLCMFWRWLGTLKWDIRFAFYR